KVQAKVLKRHVRLLPLDHAVAVVAQNQNDQIQSETDGGFQLLRVHHKAAVTADGDYAAIRINQFGSHGRRQAGTHGGQRIVQQYGIGFVGRIVAGKPDFVHAVIQRDDAVIGHRFAQLLHQPLRQHGKAIIFGAAADVFLQGIANTVEVGETPV